jgi:hypothetical protein
MLVVLSLVAGGCGDEASPTLTPLSEPKPGVEPATESETESETGVGNPSSAPALPPSGASEAAIDLDGDGVRDLAVQDTSKRNGKVAIHLSYRAQKKMISLGKGHVAIGFGDFDHDGRADLLEARLETEAAARVYRIAYGRGDGSFEKSIEAEASEAELAAGISVRFQ